MAGLLRQLSKSKSGSTAAEYAVMVGLIGIAGYMFVEGATQLNDDLIAASGNKVDTAWKRALARTAPAAGPQGLKIRHIGSDEQRARDLQRRISPAAGAEKK